MISAAVYYEVLIPQETVIGEVGQVTDLTHVTQTVTLSRAYANPVVFAQPLSRNGGDTAVVRITDVQSDRFTFFVDADMTTNRRACPERSRRDETNPIRSIPGFVVIWTER